MHTRGRLLLVFVLEVVFVNFFGHRAIHKLDVGHRRSIAGSVAALENTGVPTGAFLVPRAELTEQLADGVLAASARKRHSAVGDRVVLGERNERLGNATQLLGLGHRGLDDLVLDERDGHVPEHRLAMRAVPVELTTTLTMAHDSVSSNPSMGSASRRGSFLLQ